MDEQSRIDNRISYEIWADAEGYKIKDGINYLQKPEFFKRAQEISELSKSQLQEAAVAEKMETVKKRNHAITAFGRHCAQQFFLFAIQ